VTGTYQTLDRGLTALEHIATADRPPSIDALAATLGVHRSIAYRIVRTLEDHGLACRDHQGHCHPGGRLFELTRRARASLQAAAHPEMTAMADDLAMTAFLVVQIGDDAVTIASVEPSSTIAHVAYRPGTRHPVDRGAPGLALLAGAGPLPGERDEVALARARGWSHTESEVLPGMASVASPVMGPDGSVEAAVACTFLAAAEVDIEATAKRVVRGATTIAVELCSGNALVRA
jgi:DNA-binding IclR family transcriptional regulator